jgi:hypothetical protein
VWRFEAEAQGSSLLERKIENGIEVSKLSKKNSQKHMLSTNL